MALETPFREFAELCAALEGTTKRNEKIELVAKFLKSLQHDEVIPTVSFLIGRPFPETAERVLEVRGQTLWRFTRVGKQASFTEVPITIKRVSQYFDEIANATGAGSRAKKLALVESLLSQVSEKGADYLVRIMLGEMRIGAVEGVVLDAIASAANVDSELVRRSHMLIGSTGEVARIALTKGASGLKESGIVLFNPVRPMLAEMSYDLEEVFDEHKGRTGLEFKYDGARIQIHRKTNAIRIFSRRLSDVTASLPDIVKIAKSEIVAESFLIEGEVVAVGDGDKPLPFQDLMRRFRRVREVDEMVEKIPLNLFLFDALYVEGRALIDLPCNDRWKILGDLTAGKYLARRIISENIEEAESFLKEAFDAGHEGLMAKALDSPYTPGVRGKRWFKIKPAKTMDVAIVAAEWGSGRRRGWLSNYHLGVRDETTGDYLMIGKTFKGLTDDEFRDMTKRLLELKVSEGPYTVYVRPKVVVEVAYNEIQKSPHYKSGFALRFARITKIREDKSPEEIDSASSLKRLYDLQFREKAKIEL